MSSALELTEKVPTSWPALGTVLARIPPRDVPIALPARLALLGPTRPEVRTLLDQWAASGSTNLKKAVSEARQGLS
jgi:hypothetical protein